MRTDYETVQLAEAAYEKLQSQNLNDETLSETVKRLATERPTQDFAGQFSDEETEAIPTTRTKSYESYLEYSRRQNW